MVTEITREPAAESNDSDVDDSDDVQGDAACVTVSSSPPIAIVPVLVAPAGLAATRYVTVPSPEPDAPVRMVIHDTPGTAFHAQPDGTLMLTVSSSPAARMFCVAGVNVTSHAAPACVITKDSPATVSVVDRELLVVFAATLYPTLPLPEPDVEVENVTQLAGLCAVHAQPEPAVMAIVPVPELEATDALVGEIAYPHPAACVTVTAWPATVSTPERDCVVALAATEYETVPDPVPLAPLVIDIQDTALVAFQVQPATVVTETLPVPPAVAALAVVGFTV